MTVPFNFATQSGNIPLSELDANFANVSAHTVTATYVTGNNQSNITNVGTLNSLSVYGNVTAGNVSTNGIVRANAVVSVNYTGTNVSVTGNITGANITVTNLLEFGNISASGNVTAGGNITGGNLVTAGLISAVGNITGGNVETVNLVVNRISSDDSSYVTVEDGLEVHGDLISESLDVAGNTVMNNLTVTGNFVGTDIQVNSIVNGSSNVDITNPNGNVTIGVNGVNNMLVVTSTGADVAGNISGYNLVINNIASDDSTAVSVLDDLSVHGDIDAIGDISATGNITGSYVFGNGSQLTGVVANSVGTLVSLSVTGNTTTGNLLTGELISATGTVTGGNVVTGGLISATGTVTGGNLVIPNGGKITGDFTNTTANGRTIFQTSVTSGATLLAAIPNGLSTTSAFLAHNSSNTVNYVSGAIIANATAVSLRSLNTGNAAPLPIVFETGNVARATIDVNGNVGIANATPVDTLSVGGNAYVSGNVTAGGNVVTGGVVSATGTVTGGNVVTGGVVSATGNIVTSGYFVGTFAGNISGNLVVPGSNTQVLFNDNGNAFAVPGFTYSTDSNTMTVLGVVSSQGNVSAGNVVTGGLISATGTVTGGNLVIPNGGKITGDFGASVAGGRTIFQTSVANGSTILTSVPNGTNSTAGLVAYNSSDTVNYVSGAIIANTTAISLRSANIGNAAPLPILIETGNVVRATFDINGNVGIGNTVPVDTLSVGGNAYVSGNVTGGNVLTGGLISATGNVTGGNLIIPNGGKITGDFGTSVAGGRTVFQSSIANGSTILTAIPNGTNSTAGLVAYNSSNTVNYVAVAVIANTTAISLRSANIGNAAPLPILFETGNSVRATIDVNGNVGIANTVPVDTLSVGGNAYVSGKVTTLPTALANLTAVAGARAFINNANLVASGNFGTLVGSGGANVVPVWSDGTNWYIG